MHALYIRPEIFFNGRGVVEIRTGRPVSTRSSGAVRKVAGILREDFEPLGIQSSDASLCFLVVQGDHTRITVWVSARVPTSAYVAADTHAIGSERSLLQNSERMGSNRIDAFADVVHRRRSAAEVCPLF